MAEESKKEQFISLLKSTGRKGVDSLIDYLETKTDFFTAPASTKYHSNFEGGLLEHSLNVYSNFSDLLGMKGIDIEEDSVIVCSLLHDLCKCNFYTKEQRNRKVDGKWEQYDVWSTVKDLTVPLPHSSRSIRIIKNFIPLKFAEELTIFYHMGPFGGDDYEYRTLLNQVYSQYPQAVLFYTADLIATSIDEKISE